MSQLTSKFLLEGYAFALEQCGVLLRDATILFGNGSYSSAIALTMFAREELGRSKILLDARKEIFDGKSITPGELKRRCDNHVAKQQRGNLSTIRMAEWGSSEAKIMQTMMTAAPGSEEWREAHMEHDKIIEAYRKRAPNTRHRLRMDSLYVEPNGDASWNRPSATPKEVARLHLDHAANDYSNRYHQGYIPPAGDNPTLKSVDPELYSALELWLDRPLLLPPRSPGWDKIQGGAIHGQIGRGLHTGVVGVLSRELGRIADHVWRSRWRVRQARIILARLILKAARRLAEAAARIAGWT